jgi:hypothetical protein
MSVSNLMSNNGIIIDVNSQYTYSPTPDGAFTLSPVQILNGCVRMPVTAAARNVTFPTSAALTAYCDSISGGSNGSGATNFTGVVFDFVFINDGASAVTLVASNGIISRAGAGDVAKLTVAATSSVSFKLVGVYNGPVANSLTFWLV